MDTLTAGLIGSHIQKTRLPRALGLLCDEAGIRLQFELIDTDGVAGFDFDATVDDLKIRDWSGVTVTHPHKTNAARYAGESLCPEIARLGASNTLVFGPPLRGHNTDFTGFVSAWHTGMGNTSPGKVALAGAGGVARALAFALADLGATGISIWDIEPGKAQQLADECGHPAQAISPTKANSAVSTADGLINATALGMEHAPGMAFQPDHIGPQSWAFDAVYTPTNTTFLKTCHAAGLECLTGFDLFCHMAIGSFEAYTGIAVDKQSALRKLAALRPED
ncbi:shikimate dehydrogenase [Anderseniella sp. Alg231-50]|uniref:shikimate dehydrogenase n=1 Tax=Anderseniella sp. Alg231-50 TaxID=1922226 RepID=UPI000D556231